MESNASQAAPAGLPPTIQYAMSGRGLRGKTIEGLRFGVTSKLLVSGLQILTSVSIARYLSAADYGIVTYAMVYLNFLSLFSDFGISSAAVQQENLKDEALSTALALKAGLSVALCGLGIAAGVALALFQYREAGAILCLLSMNFIITTLGFLPQVLLTRALNFRALAYVAIASSLATTLITILLLTLGFRYWSVALGFLGASGVSVTVLNWQQKAPCRLAFDRRIGSTLLRFGGPLFLAGLINFAVLNADNLLIGSIEGPAALGQYALAFTFSFVVTGQVGGLLVSVLFPIYSRMQQDRDQLRRVYLRSLSYAATIVMLINGGLFCLSRQFLVVVIGGGSAKWLPAETALRILCVNGILAGLLFPLAPLITAIGRPGLMLRAVAVAAAIEVALIVPALRLAGIEGVAVAVTMACLAQYFIYLPAMKKAFGISRSELAHAVGPAIAGGAAMLGAARLLATYEVFGPGWMALLGQAACLGVSYVSVHTVVSKGRIVQELRVVFRETFSGDAEKA